MPEEKSPELRTVIDRFNASTTSLEQLRERLRALELAERTQTRAASALEGSADGISEYSRQAHAAAEALRAASDEVRKAVEAAASFLSTTDLSEVHQAVADLTATVATLSSSVETQAGQLRTTQTAIDQLSALFQGQVQAAQRELAGAQVDVATLKEQLAVAQKEAVEARTKLGELEAKVASVPERARKRAGL